MAVIGGIITEVGQIGLWLQAIGIVVILMIMFNIISFFYNRKRLKEIAIIKKNMNRIEGKIDKIIKQTN